MFKPAITDKSRAIIAERTADKGGETSMQRLMEPTSWSKRKAYNPKNRAPMPIYKGFSMIPVRDWEGVDQWTGNPRSARSGAAAAVGPGPPGSARKRPPQPPPGSRPKQGARARTPPRAKTPARGGAASSRTKKGDANAAEKAALQKAAAAHEAARVELEAALQRVQMLSDAATTTRSGALCD